MLRSPVVAGRFYAGTAEALASDVALCMKEGAAVAAAVPPGSEQPVAVMLPHAGHVYCGRVIGATLSGVRLPRLLVLLCPNHTGRGTPLSVWPGGAWRTPLGDVPCDDAFIASLTARAPFAADSLAHMGEHSLEVLLPFLQCLPGTESVIVPVCVGTAQPAVLRAAGVVLAELLAGRDDAAFVVSSDMNHYEPEKVTCIKDRAALDRVLALDPDGLLDIVARHGITMCGAAPMALALYALHALHDASGRPLPQAAVLLHETSARASGDTTHCVGYAGVRFWQEKD